MRDGIRQTQSKWLSYPTSPQVSSLLPTSLYHRRLTIMQNDTRFFDEASYLSQIREEALTQESTIFHTAHCPQNRFLLASSNQGRLAIWDLSSYLFPKGPSSSLSSPSFYSSTSYPIASSSSYPLVLQGFQRQLHLNQARLYSAELRRKGYPCLSLQVSHHAINHILFLGQDTAQPLLVLAGDDGIYSWPWKTILNLLPRTCDEEDGVEGTDNEPCSSTTINIGPPSSILKALPSQKAFPFLTESNQITSSLPPSSSSSSIFSACGDALVRNWDIETQQCTSLLIGHTGYVHAVKSLGIETTAPGVVVSGGEDGMVGVWDVRTGGGGKKGKGGKGGGSLIRMMDGWASAGVISSSNRSSSSSDKEGRSQAPSWVASLDVDRGGNFLVAGGGVEGGDGGGRGGGNGGVPFGYLSVFHLPSFSLVSCGRSDCVVHAVGFGQEKIVSVGNERQALHWSRPGLEGAARVMTGIPSVFSMTMREGPAVGDGVMVYAGRAGHVSVFVNPEHCAFNLKFR